MNNERIRQITSRARQWAESNGFKTESDDIVQHVLLQIAQKRRTDISKICIDYLRLTYGRTGKGKSKTQNSKYHEKRAYEDINDGIYRLETTYDINIDAMDFQVIQRYIKTKERAILTLRFKWGFSEKEIADCFGLTESRVCQILSDIEIKIKKKLLCSK